MANSSFNYGAYGISQDQWNSWSPAVQSVISLTANYSNVLAQKNQQLPTNLSKKTLAKLWKDAENDPTIKKYYADDLKIGTKTLTDNLNLMTADFQQMSDTEKQNYIDAKHQLDEAAQKTGQVYSGFRNQASSELTKQTQDVIASSRRTAQSNLDTLESQFEQTYGSKALAGLNLNPLTAGSGSLIGGQANWKTPDVASVGYTAIGGLAGTQEQQKLADIEAQYQSNISDKQTKQGTNAKVQQYNALNGLS